MAQTARTNAAFLPEPPQSPAAKAVYEDDLASDGYVNNLTRVWCWRPDVLMSFQSLAWGARLAGMSDEETAAGVLRGDEADLSERETALADWSRRVVTDPNATTEADTRRLREAGLSDRPPPRGT
ncbi:hypothetical protein O7622_17480 [Micromonospora sp. WMMD1076]|uniref:hypothetical protein n=1 Tax=Micromonospora sp. WMMD1076 TaxID=3016103 RepID=UPI00249B6F0C|nr:hypothetical protein [Micromonospora sp. WMMD1076]WFF04859.1 hypothetical protein O7622_17480 [Micromonospora sp. WMMD1076]